MQALSGSCGASFLQDWPLLVTEGEPSFGEGIEAALVRRCRRYYLSDLTDDRVCPKCRQVAATAVVTVCSCGSPLRQKGDPRAAAVRQVHGLAVQHGLVWLREVAEYTLEAFGDRATAAAAASNNAATTATGGISR